MARGVPRRLSGGLTFGGRVPPSVGAILLVILIASVVNALGSAWLLAVTALVPELVLGGQLWRVVTWPFVQSDALTVVFVGLTLWWVATQLAWEWGERTFVLRFLGIAAGAGIATSLVALVWAPANVPQFGAWPVTLALVFAWGLLHPGAQLNFWGIIPMTGRLVAQVILFGTILWAIFRGGIAGIAAFVPNFAALGVAWVQLAGGGGMRRSWMRAKRRWFEWRFERKTRHLTVVKKKDAEDERPRWMN
jgi:membrane associated rhomboid family serine protease